MPDIKNFIQTVLTKEQIVILNALIKITDSESRQSQLKSFFHTPGIFNKIKPTIDPAWLSYQIFINSNSKAYEF
jgi:hypothetical protein